MYVAGLKAIQKPELNPGEDPDFIFRRNSETFLISASDLSFAANIFNFLFKTEKDKKGEETKYLYSRLNVNLLKSFKHKGVEYIGPADALTNCLFAEYIHTETSYVDYCRTREPMHLQKIMAVLYRPADPKNKPDSIDYTGDCREKFNDFLISERAAIFTDVHPRIKNMIYLFYSGCHNYIHASYPDVFSGGGSSSPKKQAETFTGFMKLVNALANNDVTKNEQIRQSYLWEVLVTLNELAQQRIEMEDKLKNKK